MPTVGHLLPVLEVVVGLCLVLGLLTRGAAVVSALLFVAFIVGIASAWARGLQIDCGCFGGGGTTAGRRRRVPVGDRPRRRAAAAVAVPGLAPGDTLAPGQSCSFRRTERRIPMSKKSAERSRSRAGRRAGSRSSAARAPAPQADRRRRRRPWSSCVRRGRRRSSQPRDTTGEAAADSRPAVDDYAVVRRRRRTRRPRSPSTRTSSARSAGRSRPRPRDAGRRRRSRPARCRVEYRPVAFLDDASATTTPRARPTRSWSSSTTPGPDAFAELPRPALREPARRGRRRARPTTSWSTAPSRPAPTRTTCGRRSRTEVFKQWVVNATDQMSKDGVTARRRC